MTTNESHINVVIVVSGASGTGKSTICDRLVEANENLVYNVSCTTRAPRGNEVDGVDYLFLSRDAFEAKVKAGEFLEHAEYVGNYYGTLKSTILESLESNKDVIMDIETQGASILRKKVATWNDNDLVKRGYIDIFILPPSLDALRQRLENRQEDLPEVIEIRIRSAEKEISEAPNYLINVVNNDLEDCIAEMQERVEAERCKRSM